MIKGIGCDVLYINRVESLIKYERFLYKFFTNSEINMFNREKIHKNYLKKIASNLCVKEAFFKSISHIVDKFNFKDVEVLRYNSGKPYINLINSLKVYEEDFNIHVSISNERDIVTSYVILEKSLKEY